MKGTVHSIGKERPSPEGRNDRLQKEGTITTSEGKGDREGTFLIFRSFLIWMKGLNLFYIVDLIYLC